MHPSHTRSRADASTGRWITAALDGLVLFFCLAGGIAAQDSAKPALPVLEPRLTRIIGSDTLQIVEPALSPDGRWVVFSTWNGVGEGYLWIVSSDGGEPRRLIETRNVREPTWFPTGDRLAYWSEENTAIMSVAFDGRLGQISGRPQRITLEKSAYWFRLSPDARWIAYRIWSEREGRTGMVIRVIPSNGGTARTLDVFPDLLILMDWSADGRYLYYGAGGRNFRIAVDGGSPEPLSQPPTGSSAPRIPYFVVAAPGFPGAGPPFLVVSFEGRPVARVALPQGAAPDLPGRSFTDDGKRLLAVVSNTAHPMRVLPVAGGAARQLGEARAPEVPLGWSPEGNAVLFATKLDGREAIMSVPVAGGAAREIGPMPDRGPATRDAWRNPITFSADGRHLTYSRPTPGSGDRTLVVRPVAGGEERVITPSLMYHSGFRLVGPGGTPNIAGTDFLYLERKGDRAELRAIPPEGASRLLRSFAATDVGIAKSKGVFEDWVAYVHAPDGQQPGWGTTDPVNAPLRIVVARGPGGTPKEVAAVPGVAAYDDIVWSPDGRWIAATTFADSSQGGGIKVLLVGVTPEGNVSSPARLIDTPIDGSAWGLQWLPDGSAVTLYGQSPPDMDFDIWLVPVRNSGRPVSLTRDEGNGIVYSLLSPDGRYVAYQASIQRGASLWLADLGDALMRIRSGGTR